MAQTHLPEYQYFSVHVKLLRRPKEGGEKNTEIAVSITTCLFATLNWIRFCRWAMGRDLGFISTMTNALILFLLTSKFSL